MCLCRSGDKIHPEDWGGRITELFPDYVGLPAVTEPPIGGEGQPKRNNPMWIRVYLRHDKIANAVNPPLKNSIFATHLAAIRYRGSFAGTGRLSFPGIRRDAA